MYARLKKLMLLIWKDDDMIDQDTLFKRQSEFAKLLLEVATKEGKTDDLVKTFPWLYARKS